MCHFHNDYWRREPLYRALQVGCTGVEADVWHFDDELYVAHTISGIGHNRTLESLYLDRSRQESTSAVPVGPNEARSPSLTKAIHQRVRVLYSIQSDPLEDYRSSCERNFHTHFSKTLGDLNFLCRDTLNPTVHETASWKYSTLKKKKSWLREGC